MCMHTQIKMKKIHIVYGYETVNKTCKKVSMNALCVCVCVHS